ncbi:MAG: DNA primase small subunit domain-containing protein [Nitrososphaerales archaeon]
MNERSLEFLKKEFKWYYYYKDDEIEEPKRIEEREFGYMPFSKGMIRHLSLKSRGELIALLLREVPAGVYCSCSYYLSPHLPMGEKGWKGSDLIFDIDADGLNSPCKTEHDRWICKNCGFNAFGKRPELCPNCNSLKIEEISWSCDLCMNKAKEEVLKLLEILEEDFGLSRKEIQIYFSGNMGYHIQVQSPLIEELNQDGRNEIVDYLSCKGLNIEKLGFVRGLRYDEILQRLSNLDYYGWGRRLLKFFENNYNGNPTIKLAEMLSKEGYKKFSKALKDLFDQLSVKIDREVTIDLHRIFRLPGSLHQRSGLIKKKVNDLDYFDPYDDTCPFNDEPVKIRISFSPKFRLKGKEFGPYKNETLTLPKYACLFLVARGVAEVEG